MQWRIEESSKLMLMIILYIRFSFHLQFNFVKLQRFGPFSFFKLSFGRYCALYISIGTIFNFTSALKCSLRVFEILLQLVLL